MMKGVNTMSNLTKIPMSKLPSGIIFSENGDTLLMEMSQTGITANMQENNSAFEAWALLARTAGYTRVELSGNECTKEMSKAEKRHYHRFLYRVLRFEKGFDWFSITDSLREKAEAFERIELSRDLFVNAPIVEAKPQTDSPEANMERLLVCDENRDFLNNKLHIKIDKFYNQLPVGLFGESVKSETAIFPRSHAAIDIWGLDGNAFHLIELKVKSNQKLSVLSEVLFYACFINDMYCQRNLERKSPINLQKYGEKLRGYPELIKTGITSVVAHILTEKKHSQLDKAFAELHLCKLNGIRFDNAECYSPSELIVKLQ